MYCAGLDWTELLFTGSFSVPCAACYLELVFELHLPNNNSSSSSSRSRWWKRQSILLLLLLLELVQNTPPTLFYCCLAVRCWGPEGTLVAPHAPLTTSIVYVHFRATQLSCSSSSSSFTYCTVRTHSTHANTLTNRRQHRTALSGRRWFSLSRTLHGSGSAAAAGVAGQLGLINSPLSRSRSSFVCAWYGTVCTVALPTIHKTLAASNNKFRGKKVPVSIVYF